jgi:hypothetical protein
VRFNVRGIVQLAGRKPQPGVYFPEQATEITIGQTCRTLHFLHSTGETAPVGTTIGHYVLHYADGRIREFPIIYGLDLREYHDRSGTSEAVERGQVAWKDTDKKWNFRLYKSSWDNPRPEVEVATLDFVSAMTDCHPFLIAITVE